MMTQSVVIKHTICFQNSERSKFTTTKVKPFTSPTILVISNFLLRGIPSYNDPHHLWLKLKFLYGNLIKSTNFQLDYTLDDYESYFSRTIKNFNPTTIRQSPSN